MTGADALVQILKAEGIRHAFCFPTTPVLEAMARADLRVLLARQERVAGNMADGVSRSTNGNQIGTWTVQQSAGAENAFAAISHSFTDSTPVLFIPGHPGVSKANIPPTFDAVPNYAELKSHALPGTSKYHRSVGCPTVWPQLRSNNTTRGYGAVHRGDSPARTNGIYSLTCRSPRSRDVGNACGRMRR